MSTPYNASNHEQNLPKILDLISCVLMLLQNKNQSKEQGQRRNHQVFPRDDLLAGIVRAPTTKSKFAIFPRHQLFNESNNSSLLEVFKDLRMLVQERENKEVFFSTYCCICGSKIELRKCKCIS